MTKTYQIVSVYNVRTGALTVDMYPEQHWWNGLQAAIQKQEHWDSLPHAKVVLKERGLIVEVIERNIVVSVVP